MILSCCPERAMRLHEDPPDALVGQTEIGPLYDKLSRFYDLWGAMAESRARQRAIELADIKDGQNILEVAVGTGLAFEKIVRLNPNGQNTGIDLSKGMLAKARKRLKKITDVNYRLEMGSAMALETPSGSMDLLMNGYMFDLISFDQMDGVLNQFWRVLKSGGKLVMVNMTRPQNRSSGFFEQIYHRFPRAMGGCRGITISPRLEQRGFRVISREYIRQLFFPSEVVVALKP